MFFLEIAIKSSISQFKMLVEEGLGFSAQSVLNISVRRDLRNANKDLFVKQNAHE